MTSQLWILVIGAAIAGLVQGISGFAFAMVAMSIWVWGVDPQLAAVMAVFGGVTGSGTDFLVAAFQQAGSDLSTAVLQQGLLSDPIDKTVTFFVVFVLLQTLSRRFLARFPQGEKAVRLEAA